LLIHVPVILPFWRRVKRFCFKSKRSWMWSLWLVYVEDSIF